MFGIQTKLKYERHFDQNLELKLACIWIFQGVVFFLVLDSDGFSFWNMERGERTESERTVVISGGIRCKEPSRPHMFTIEFLVNGLIIASGHNSQIITWLYRDIYPSIDQMCQRRETQGALKQQRTAWF